MLTDKQLTWLFENRLSSHNGFKCSNLDNVCRCTTIIIDGRLTFDGNFCGEPCSFLKDATALSESINEVKLYEQYIQEAKEQA